MSSFAEEVSRIEHDARVYKTNTGHFLKIERTKSISRLKHRGPIWSNWRTSTLAVVDGVVVSTPMPIGTFAELPDAIAAASRWCRVQEGEHHAKR